MRRRLALLLLVAVALAGCAKSSADVFTGAVLHQKYHAPDTMLTDTDGKPFSLAASTDKLKVVASAFLDNLKSLSERSVGACYGFISQGETAPVVLELMQTPDQGASVQTQVAAIFEAIADGRKTPTQHEKAVKTDYEVLVQELSKLGWKENDLKVFSNPQALSHEPPSRVCQMVQDWFTAHLAVADKATQERLLVETLKPVVSG